jgi:hypothetical protein
MAIDSREAPVVRTQWSLAVLLATALALSACSEQPAAVPYFPPSPEALASAVSASVELVTAAGQTRIKRDEDDARRDKLVEMTQQQATRLGGLFIARFGAFQKRAIELYAGVPVDVARLTPCRSTRYAKSAFEPADLRRLPPHERSRYAAQWIVPMCDGSALRAMVAFSAHADPDAVSLDKDALMPNLGAANFFVSGISEAKANWILDEPEAAVLYAAQASGATVASAPQLVILPRSGAARPFWRVALSRKVGIVNDDDGKASQDSVLYVGGSDLEKQFVPTGTALYVGFSETDRKPKKAKLKLGRVPPGLRKDPSITLEVAKVTRVNGKAVGDAF